jgi:hypothetical protein
MFWNKDSFYSAQFLEHSKSSIKIFLRPDVVAQAYNSSYLEDRDWEDCISRPAGKRFMILHLNKWLSFISAMWGITNRRIVVQGSPGTKVVPVSKITSAKRAGGLDQTVE